MNKKFTLKLPEEFVSALNRRHNGREIEDTEKYTVLSKMHILYNQYKKYKSKLDYCEKEWWNKMEIEKYFKKSRWYYAHRKRKILINIVKDLHKQMFYLLLHTDGNYEEFSEFNSLSAEEIYEDFNRKYNKHNI